MSTHPLESWSFTATPEKIDLVRIIRELNEVGARLALIIIEGKFYTAWRHDHPCAGEIKATLVIAENDPHGCQEEVLPHVFLNVNGDPMIRTYNIELVDLDDPCEGDWYLRAGDHTAHFQERLLVDVEVVQ